jgi:hypothetical protein
MRDTDSDSYRHRYTSSYSYSNRYRHPHSRTHPHSHSYRNGYPNSHTVRRSFLGELRWCNAPRPAGRLGGEQCNRIGAALGHLGRSA